MLSLLVRSLEETAQVAKQIAEQIVQAPFSLLLEGTLGAGKTSFVRELVAHLPNGSTAEVSSPSFTICNIYDCQPQVYHCDLYRSGKGAQLPDEVYDALENKTGILVLEWSEYLREQERPKDALRVSFDIRPHSCESHRALMLTANGQNASSALLALQKQYSPSSPLFAELKG